eukprot:jgi/Psemu1/326597/estExt_fgenesh1_pg.C_4220004
MKKNSNIRLNEGCVRPSSFFPTKRQRYPVTTDGGEVIYSDVGLAPVGVTKPPLVVQEQTAGDSSAEEAVLSSDQLSPQAAFEIFQGKVYNASIPSSSLASTFGKHKHNNINNININTKVEHVARDYDRSSLPPLERLARLQQEVEALESELGATAADSGRAFDEQVVKMATDLKNRLVAASSAHVTEQDDLTRMIQQQLQGMRVAGKNGGDGAGEGEQGGAATATAASSPQTDMEQLVATVDSATLEKTATKAKVIRADLEAASKARNKLTATYKKEDSKMIQQLYQQMIDLEGLGNYLPNLVERLQQLSNLHQQASTFGTRLQELERDATQVEATVGQLEDGMATLQTTIAQNMVAMESNMKQLDEKLGAL